MQQHVHPREVVGGDVLLLPVDLADAVRPHALAHIEQQRARAAGEVHHAGEVLPLAGLRLLAVERDDRGEDVRYPLRRVELTGLLARARGELADQVLVGVAEGVAVRGELRKALGYLGDDRAELRVPVWVGLAELVGAEIDLREQTRERALERFVLDVLEACLERVEQLAVLGAGHVGDAGPEVLGADDVMRLETHLLLEVRHIIGVLLVPDRQGGPPAVADGVRVGVVAPEFLLRGLLVVVREVAEEQEREHVVAEVVRVHRSTELVCDGPERFAKLFLVVLGHELAGMGDERVPRVQLLINLVKQRQAVRYEEVGFVIVDILVGEGVHDSSDLIRILEADAFECIADPTDTEERRHALQQLTEKGKVVCADLFLLPSLLQQLRSRR